MAAGVPLLRDRPASCANRSSAGRRGREQLETTAEGLPPSLRRPGTPEVWREGVGPKHEGAPGEPGPLPFATGGTERPRPGPGNLGRARPAGLNVPKPKARRPFGERFQVDCSGGWRRDAPTTCPCKVTFLVRAPAGPTPPRRPIGRRRRGLRPLPLPIGCTGKAAGCSRALTHSARGGRRHTGGRRGWRAPRP